MDLKTKHDLGTKLYQKNILRRKHEKEKESGTAIAAAHQPYQSEIKHV